MNMIVDCAGYENGRRACTLAIDEVRDWISGDNCFAWIGLYEPDEELLQQVQKQFGLHDLAVEDAWHAHQRPKLDFYADSLFMVLHTAQSHGGKVEFGETHIFAGRGYVVTIRHGASSSYREVRNRCESSPAMLQKGADFVLYALMDFIVDNYRPVIHEFEAIVADIEKGILQRKVDVDVIANVYELKRNLLQMRLMVSPVVDICNRLVRFDSALIDDDVRPYFRDVHDHAMHVDEMIDTMREMISSALEANLLLTSVQQNEVMKKLAGYAAMMAVPTAIAGIYGMNFENIPELHWHYGYYAVISVMASSCAFLYYRFRKAGWF